MDFDDLLKDAWQGQARAAAQQELTGRIRRRRQRLRFMRAMGVMLMVIAVLVFGEALLRGRREPVHWLLMPFFIVFLPMAWAIVLRAPRRHAMDATGSAGAYARLRLAQLRTGLRDLWLAGASAWALIAYAAIANAGARLLAGDAWRSAGLAPLVMAIACLGATLGLGRLLCRHWWREHRAVRRRLSD